MIIPTNVITTPPIPEVIYDRYWLSHFTLHAPSPQSGEAITAVAVLTPYSQATGTTSTDRKLVKNISFPDVMAASAEPGSTILQAQTALLAAINQYATAHGLI